MNGALYFVAWQAMGWEDPMSQQIWALPLAGKNVQMRDNDLIVAGTPEEDTIVIKPGTDPGDVDVLINGESWTFPVPTGQILVYGSGGNDTVTVSATGLGGARIDGQSGSDHYFVDFGNLAGPVTVADAWTAADADTLTVNGVDDVDNYIEKTGSVTSWGNPATQIVTYSRLKELTLVGGSKTNTFIDPDTGASGVENTRIVAGPAGSSNAILITSTAGNGVVIDDGGGANNITIEMSQLAAPVTVNGTTGTSDVTINAPSGTNDLVVTATQLTSHAETISFVGSAPSRLTLNLDGGANDVHVQSTSSAGVTINAQGGTDNYTVDLGSLAGPVTVGGEATAASVTVVGTQEPDVVTLSGTDVHAAGETIHLEAAVAALRVDAGGGDDQIAVTGFTAPIADLALDGGVGSDSFTIVDLALPPEASLTVDGGGGTGTDQVDIQGTLPENVEIQHFSPTVNAAVAPSPALQGQDILLCGAFVDPDTDNMWTAQVDYGDGSPPQTVALNPDKSFSTAHAYGATGTFMVTVTVTDSDGRVGTDTKSVTVIEPCALSGLVWEDFNDDGEVDFGEKAIAEVAVRLAGRDDRGQLVDRVMQTDADGIFEFVNLRPSDDAGYTLTESQPDGFVSGKQSLGTVNGVPTGTAADNVFAGLVLSPGSDGVNYNFAERPQAGAAVAAGQTATIGFWQNKNGQKLIASLNGGTGTQLGDWLAATFPNMYGVNAGAHNLAGCTNAQVAAFYSSLFKYNGKDQGGPPKLDAQVLAVAFAVYVTNQNLAGTTAAAYGFRVTAEGVGIATFDVGATRREAFGLDATDPTVMTVLGILVATDAQTRNGRLYDINDNGISDGIEASLRAMANEVYSAINERGQL